jgi:hypothetical protein
MQMREINLGAGETGSGRWGRWEKSTWEGEMEAKSTWEREMRENQPGSGRCEREMGEINLGAGDGEKSTWEREMGKSTWEREMEGAGDEINLGAGDASGRWEKSTWEREMGSCEEFTFANTRNCVGVCHETSTLERHLRDVT